MAYDTQPNVHGGARGGEFLTGNLSYFTIKTIVPSYPTNVTVPLAQALAARNWTSLAGGRTITVTDGNGDEVTYSSNAEYTSAYNKQKNLNTLLNVFATRANPVVVNVSATTTANADTFAAFASGGAIQDNFGTGYGAAGGVLYGVYTINIVTEKAGQWKVTPGAAGDDAGTNESGYEFLNALDGTPALSISAETPAGPQDAGTVGYTVLGGAFEVNSAANLNTVAKASDGLPAVV